MTVGDPKDGVLKTSKNLSLENSKNNQAFSIPWFNLSVDSDINRRILCRYRQYWSFHLVISAMSGIHFGYIRSYQ